MPRKRGAGTFISLNRHRETRGAPAEKFLGDPSPDRSALGTGAPPQAPRRSFNPGQRVDLWRRAPIKKRLHRTIDASNEHEPTLADEKDIDLGLRAARLAAIIGSNSAGL